MSLTDFLRLAFFMGCQHLAKLSKKSYVSLKISETFFLWNLFRLSIGIGKDLFCIAMLSDNFGHNVNLATEILYRNERKVVL